MHTDVAGKDLVMVLLDADGNSRRFADAEKLRRWLGGAPPPAPVAKKATKSERKLAAAKKPAGKTKASTVTAKRKAADKKDAQVARKGTKQPERVRKQYAAGGEDKKS
jgi:D-alanyl-D-alanine carboxypeptidase